MITRRTTLGLVAAAPFAAGCDADIAWAHFTDADERVYGTWESAATGHVIVISPAGVQVFHRLDDFWIADPGLVPAFTLFARYGDALLLQHYDYRATPYLLQAPLVFVRSAETIPAAPFLQGDEISAAAVFDLICRSYERYYAFFAERGVDWSAARRAAKPRVVATPSNDAVFDALAEMLAQLGDGHVNLSRGERHFNAGRTVLRERLKRAWEASGSAQSEQDYVSGWSRAVRASAIAALDAGTHRTTAAGALAWGRIGAAGYLRINRFSGFIEGEAPRQEQVGILQRALADAERDFASVSRVIVDVAHNGGGNDAAAMVVAQHFADAPRLVLEYRARNAPNQPIRLAPGDAAYPRQVTLLTSEITASGAESFVLMMRAFPHVTHVGGRTRGILSSLLPKPFPNAFMATIAYQRVLDANGQPYEALGIPPAREIELFPSADLTGAYTRAIGELARE